MVVSYSTNEFRLGLKLILDGDPCSIIENEIVKPGKGQAFNRIKVRNLKTGRVVERTFKSGERIEAADVLEKEMQYLYEDTDTCYFMDPKTYEQLEVSTEIVADVKKWLKGQNICLLTLWNDMIISVSPPNFVILQIVETDPAIKSDTSSGSGKLATLDTGAVVRVPSFIRIKEWIKIDTRTGEYVSKAKAL